jgi:phosphoribosylaminoimidazolecarboxamide formyltransferase / IMP cyclohydrolase
VPVALLSVTDKTGLAEFAKELSSLGWDLVSTGGTARALRQAGLEVRDISDVTNFPEMLDGRVKTLHPAVHGGLLARRDDPAHMSALEQHGIGAIDLVAVNLYAFRETAALPGVTDEQVIEHIDIGGPSMLRSAAKNFASVYVVTDPADYDAVIAAIRAGEDSLDLRRRLARSAFTHTAAYDSAISTWFARREGDRFPERVTIALERAQSLRYGENPDQRAAFYVETPGAGLAGLRQRGGKELSFNNLLDLDGALLATDPFGGETACAIIKHTTPCGLAIGDSALDAYRKALACDPVSAFGSVISFTVPVDATTADEVSRLFVECIVAPSFADEAVEILVRKKNLRVLEGTASVDRDSLDWKRVRGGLLAQDRAASDVEQTKWKVVTRREPRREELLDLVFACKSVGSIKSNAIVLVRGGATIGIGAGQMSRGPQGTLRRARHPWLDTGLRCVLPLS